MSDQMTVEDARDIIVAVEAVLADYRRSIGHLERLLEECLAWLEAQGPSQLSF